MCVLMNSIYFDTEMLCDFFRFTTLLNLIHHMNDCHSTTTDVSKHSFSNVSGFEFWKREEELSTKSLYVQHSASQMHEQE